ncbi:DUF3667 domain-containing protein [Brevundimonas sp. SL130]|uniref:DUF3667 domain-containing protein n=1 Tax=Brevundimonas sp. SL130 TaxID=2995143 RepID=UPI00226C7233|nr:DUF3667 domain-containing protein [Brevundimonas sp. SL130]WAC60356.1 DUF3667 domain-containing protein [Brevundimonas sp. SL130]
MDIEGAGGVITGGLVAGAIEKPTGHAGEAGHGLCSDCGAPTSGNFCSNCGQPTHVHRTLLHLGEELLHGVMHFDARIWRTLPLLAFNPGRLTREWVEGKRTRYVSPLAIFLFTLFVMFFALSFMPHPGGHEDEAGRLRHLQEQVVEQRAGVVEAEKTVAELRTELAEQNNSVTQGALTGAQKLVENRRAALDRMETELREGRSDGLGVGTWQAEVKDMAAEGKVTSNAGLGKVLNKKLLNPDLAIYKLQQTMYKFAFLLVPFSIPFLALLFLWRRGSTLYDHGVFVLYSLTFMALLLMVMVLAVTINGPFGGFVVAISLAAIPLHVFAQLKGAYSLSIFSALWRAVLLLFFCNIVVALFITSIVYLGLGH